jgi:hypothetical protein
MAEEAKKMSSLLSSIPSFLSALTDSDERTSISGRMRLPPSEAYRRGA